jgi:DNA-binding helix-turn-helix protein|nr:MAG TPA: helix-turn-helix domain protein [Caudoviricetes sp.]
MFDSQTILSRQVKRYMADQGISQAALAADLGMTQSALSQRLSATTRWNLKDIDQLMRIGVPVGFGTLAAVINEDHQ